MNQVVTKYNKTLAQYYQSQPLWFDDKMEEPNVRKCMEQPWQHAKVEMWDDVTNTLCDILFIEANAKSNLVNSLRMLFEYALRHIQNSKNIECLQLYYSVFLRHQHLLQEYPALTFQQLFNELQWLHKTEKNKLKKHTDTLIAHERSFLHQYRVPELVNSHLIFNLTNHKHSVKSVHFAPDGKRFVTGSSDATLKVWDAEFCNELATLTGHEYMVTSCAFSKDGSRIVSGSADNTIKIWDALTYKEVATLHGHTKPITSCAFSTDGNRIVSGSRDDTIKIWNANTAIEISSISATGYGITTCNFSPNDKHIISGCLDNPTQIWNAKTGDKIISLKTTDITCCTYSPNGRYIVTGNECPEYKQGAINPELKIFEAENGNLIASYKGHKKAITSCAFSPDSKLIVTGSEDFTIKVWDITSGKEIASFDDHIAVVTSCAFSPDGKHIISGSRDKTIKYWSIDSPQKTTSLRAHQDRLECCAFAHDGSIVLTGGGDCVLNIWNPHDGSLVQQLTEHKNPIEACAISPDCKKFASGSYGDGVNIYSELKVWDIKTKESLFTKHGYRILTCAFSPDSKNIISGGNAYMGGTTFQSQLALRNADTGEDIERHIAYHSTQITSCSYSPDGKLIATTSTDGKMKITDAKSGKELKCLKYSSEEIYCCYFSPDGHYIVTGGKDCILKIWDLKTDKVIQTLNGHKKLVQSCSFSPDGSFIASSSNDSTLKIWEVETGKEISTFHAQSSVLTCSFHTDGTKLAFGDANGNLYLVKLVGFKHKPPILTAKYTLEDQNDKLIEKTTVNCPFCQTTIPCNIPEDISHNDPKLLITCPDCKKKLKLNPFLIEMD